MSSRDTDPDNYHPWLPHGGHLEAESPGSIRGIEFDQSASVSLSFSSCSKILLSLPLSIADHIFCFKSSQSRRQAADVENGTGQYHHGQQHTSFAQTCFPLGAMGHQIGQQSYSKKTLGQHIFGQQEPQAMYPYLGGAPMGYSHHVGQHQSGHQPHPTILPSTPQATFDGHGHLAQQPNLVQQQPTQVTRPPSQSASSDSRPGDTQQPRHKRRDAGRKNRPRPTTWSSTDVQIARQMRANNRSNEDIGQALGRSAQAVYNRLRRP